MAVTLESPKKVGAEKVKTCLAGLEILTETTRTLAFMAPTASGTDELYYANIDGLDMIIEGLREQGCVSERGYKGLINRFEKLKEIPWEEEKASDVIYELDKIDKIAFSSARSEVPKGLEELLADMGVFELEREKGDINLWKDELLRNATTRSVKEQAEKVIEKVEEYRRT